MNYEQEILTILMEEAAEVIQECSKMIRFDAYHNPDNMTRLNKELGDLQCMIDMVHQHDMVSHTEIDKFAELKSEKLKKWSSLFEH